MRKLADFLAQTLYRLRPHSKYEELKGDEVTYHLRPLKVSHKRSASFSTEDISLKGLDTFDSLFEIPAKDVPLIFSLSTQRILSRALRSLLSPGSSISGSNEYSVEALYGKAECFRKVHSSAVARLLKSNESLEHRIRWIAWALDAESEWKIRCLDSESFLQAVSSNMILQTKACSRHDTLVFWQSNRMISPPLMELLCHSRVKLIFPGKRQTFITESNNFIIAENSAIVERANGDRGFGRFSISSSAALCQCLLSAKSDSAWYRVRKPAGFVRLDSRMSKSDVNRSDLTGRVAVIYTDGTGRNLSISSLAYSNMLSTDCLKYRRVNMQTTNLNGRYRMSQEKGTEVMIEEDGALLDKQSEVPALIVVDLQDGPPRSKDKLQRELKEVEVSSTRELLAKFPTKITGQYVDVNGETREASISVIDEETFTPNGITLGDEELFNTYITLRTYENVGRYCEGKNRTHLTDDEVARLRATAEILEKSLEGAE